MICQYCGTKLFEGFCTNPACPGRLRGESVSELIPCPFCGSIPEVYDSETDDIREEDAHWVSVYCRKCGAEPFRHIYSDNVNEDTKRAYRDKCISKWNTRTPAPAEVEELLERYKSSWWLLGYEAASHEDYEISEENWAKMNALKSRLLAAFSNKGENLSGDVKVTVAQDDCIERIISYVDEYINDQIDRVVLKSEIGQVLNDIFFSYLVPADLTDALAEAAEEVLKELEDAHHQDIVSSRTTKELESALAAYGGDGEIICEGIELRRLKDVE